jgi:hypothetical protein
MIRDHTNAMETLGQASDIGDGGKTLADRLQEITHARSAIRDDQQVGLRTHARSVAARRHIVGRRHRGYAGSSEICTRFLKSFDGFRRQKFDAESADADSVP